MNKYYALLAELDRIKCKRCNGLEFDIIPKHGKHISVYCTLCHNGLSWPLYLTDGKIIKKFIDIVE